jgi:predicted dehydrogenase
MDSNETRRSTTRRDFLKVAGMTTAGALVGGLAKSSAYAVAPARVIGANDRINVGHIGCGGRGQIGQGQAHLRLMKQNASQFNIKSVMVCDLYDRALQDSASLVGLSQSAAVKEYARVLDNKDVDAIVIATPEHWHFKIAMDALQAGKDIYLEKPMTRTVDQALKLYKAVKASDRIVQVGSQITSNPKWNVARQMIKDGKIGHLVWSQDSYCRNNKDGEWNLAVQSDMTPDHIDWKTWLGDCPKREFSAERFLRWRKYWDYSTGPISDLLPHRAHPLMLAMGAEWPKRVSCVGGKYVSTDDREVPDMATVTVEFPSGHIMTLFTSTVNQVGSPSMIRGNKATLYLSNPRQVELKPEAPYVDEVDPVTETIEGGFDNEPIDLHEKNFFDCVRSRKQPNCNLDLATPVMVAIGLAEPALRQSKVMLFDAEKLQVVNP